MIVYGSEVCWCGCVGVIMDVFGLFASVATFVMFLLYLIGRIWSIHKATCYSTESFRVFSDNDDREYENEFDFGGSVVVEVISSMEYKSFTVTEIIEYDLINCKIIEHGKTIVRKRIPSNCPLYIKVDLPELVPFHIVEFKRADGIEGCFLIMDSGRTGEIIPVDYKLKHTLESRLYYLCR